MRKSVWILIMIAAMAMIQTVSFAQLDSALMGVGPTLIHRTTEYNFRSPTGSDRKLSALYPYSAGIFVKLFDFHFSVGFPGVEEGSEDNFTLHLAYYFRKNAFDLLFQKNVKFNYKDDFVSNVKTDVTVDQMFFNYTHIFHKKEHDFNHAYDLSAPLLHRGGAVTVFSSFVFRKLVSDSLLITENDFSSLKTYAISLGPGYSYIDHIGRFSFYAHVTAGPLFKITNADGEHSSFNVNTYVGGSVAVRSTFGKLFAGLIGSYLYQRYYSNEIDYSVWNSSFQVAAGWKFYSKRFYKWYHKRTQHLPIRHEE